MTPTKPSANEKRLAKLLVDAGGEFWVPQDEAERMAAFLAKRGVRALTRAELRILAQEEK